jgi:hypothetical protein
VEPDVLGATERLDRWARLPRDLVRQLPVGQSAQSRRISMNSDRPITVSGGTVRFESHHPHQPEVPSGIGRYL